MLIFKVIICDFPIATTANLPSKTKLPLLLDADIVLTFAVAAQFLQSVSRWDFQIIQLFRGVENLQPHSRLVLNICREGTGSLSLALREYFSLIISEGYYHWPDKYVWRYYCQGSK
jgi:hypothetical protein